MSEINVIQRPADSMQSSWDLKATRVYRRVWRRSEYINLESRVLPLSSVSRTVNANEAFRYSSKEFGRFAIARMSAAILSRFAFIAAVDSLAKRLAARPNSDARIS